MPHAPFAGMANEIDHQISNWTHLRARRDDGDELVSSPEPSPVRPRLTAEQKGKGRKPLTPITPLRIENVGDLEREFENHVEYQSEPENKLEHEVEEEWIAATQPFRQTRVPSRQTRTPSPPPPSVEDIEDEYDVRPLTAADKRDGPVFIDRRARMTNAEKPAAKPIAPMPKVACDRCPLGPPGTFCDHLSSSPETDEAMPLPAAFKDKTYAEEGPNPPPQLVVSSDGSIARPQPARQSSWDSIFEGRNRSLSGEFADEYFKMDPKVKQHCRRKRMRKPNLGDWALWVGAAVLMLGLVVPLIACSKKLRFTVTVNDPSFESDPGNWSLLSSYELKFMHYCLNYRSSNGMQSLDSTSITTECHGMSQYVFNTTHGIDLRPEDVNNGMAQIADNLAQAQHQLAWSTWGLYIYLVAAITSISYATWLSLYEGEPEVFWLTFNSLLLLIVPPTPVALCVYALTKIQNTFNDFVHNWNAQSGPAKLVLAQTGTVGLKALYWSTFPLSLMLLVAIWVKYKYSPMQRLARQKRHQTLFDEKQQLEARNPRAGCGAPDEEAQIEIVARPSPSQSIPSQPLRSNAP